MVIPFYIQITAEEYDRIIKSEPDDVVEFLSEFLESETAPVVDIDKAWMDLADEYPQEIVQRCMFGTTRLVDDPGTSVSSPAEVAAYAPEFDAIDSDEVELGTLQDFYLEAAKNNKGIAIIFN